MPGDWWKIVEEFDRKYKAGLQTDGPPWPSYNGGKQFCCEQCGTRFDTSTGIAKHQVYGCYTAAPEVTEVHKNLPSCPACGSFALYREKSGAVTCMTCEGNLGQS